MTTKPPLRIARVRDLTAHESEILRAINTTPHGALLFLSDPVRLLRECGFEVDDRLQKDLEKALPALRHASPGPYDEVKAGAIGAARWRVRIRSLGVPNGGTGAQPRSEGVGEGAPSASGNHGGGGEGPHGFPNSERGAGDD